MILLFPKNASILAGFQVKTCMSKVLCTDCMKYCHCDLTKACYDNP